MANYLVITIEDDTAYPFFDNVMDKDISDAFNTIMTQIISDSAESLADSMVDNDDFTDFDDAIDHAYDMARGLWSNKVITDEKGSICSSYNKNGRHDKSLIVINSKNIYWDKSKEIIEILNILERLNLSPEHVLEMINETAL